MDITCGSFALRGAKAKKNAVVVDLLIEAGMIIIAKTNLTVRFHCAQSNKRILIPSSTGVRRNERLNDDQWLVCSWWTGMSTMEGFANAWLTTLFRPDRLTSEANLQQLPS